jgi:putative membrane protein
MMDYGYGHGDGHWGMWIVMVVAMLVFWGALAWIIVTLVRERSHHTHVHGVMPTGSPDPLQILAERLARGEIDEDDYTRRVELLKR